MLPTKSSQKVESTIDNVTGRVHERRILQSCAVNHTPAYRRARPASALRVVSGRCAFGLLSEELAMTGVRIRPRTVPLTQRVPKERDERMERQSELTLSQMSAWHARTGTNWSAWDTWRDGRKPAGNKPLRWFVPLSRCPAPPSFCVVQSYARHFGRTAERTQLAKAHR